MDATAAAAKAVGSGADTDAAPSSWQTAAPKPVPVKDEPFPVPGDAAAVADLTMPATATTSGNIAESGVEDEQVEKFYALLANIRAMRGMYARRTGEAGASTDDTTSEVCGGVRKRARWAEQPWRPTFRMEDFEEAPSGCVGKKVTRDDGDATSRRLGKESTEEAAAREGDDAGTKGRRVATPSPPSKV